MYNNVGIRTPRGSGTSGHVMSNRSHVRPQNFRMGVQRNTGKLQGRGDWEEPPTKKANGELLDHQRKRKVEAKIFELQEAMAERGYNDAEIEEKVAEVRKGLEERVNNGQHASLPTASAGGAMDSHMRDVKKAEDNRKMREAFGLGDDYAAGEAFDEEAQERKKEARKKERVAKEAEREAKKAQKAAEEKKRKKEAKRKEKEMANNGNGPEGSEKARDSNDRNGGGRDEGKRIGADRDREGEENEEDVAHRAAMKKRAERFGANDHEADKTADISTTTNPSRKGRGQFLATGGRFNFSGTSGRGRDGRGGDGDRGWGGGEERWGRGNGRDARGRGGYRPGGGRAPPVTVRDALSGRLNAPRGGGRLRNGRHDEDERNAGIQRSDHEDGEFPKIGVVEEERWRPGGHLDEDDGADVGYGGMRGAKRHTSDDEAEGSPAKKPKPLPRKVTVVAADQYRPALRRSSGHGDAGRHSSAAKGRDDSRDRGDRVDGLPHRDGVDDHKRKRQAEPAREVIVRNVSDIRRGASDRGGDSSKKGKSTDGSGPAGNDDGRAPRPAAASSRDSEGGKRNGNDIEESGSRSGDRRGGQEEGRSGSGDMSAVQSGKKRDSMGAGSASKAKASGAVVDARKKGGDEKRKPQGGRGRRSRNRSSSSSSSSSTSSSDSGSDSGSDSNSSDSGSASVSGSGTSDSSSDSDSSSSSASASPLPARSSRRSSRKR